MPSVLVSEIQDIIIGVLAADPELQGLPLEGRIFPDIEDTSVYPVVVVSGVTGENTRTLNNNIVWRDAVIQITIRDKGGPSKANLVLIARRVCIVLQGAVIQQDGIYIGKLSEARERPVGPERINGEILPRIILEFDTKAYRP